MISIVIPLYNKAHTIVKTLDSVLVQNFNEFEIVIIDDGSTDNGIETIKKYTSDKRIIYYSQPNQGVSAARNKGIELSKFEHIAFLDGDDEWLPDYLSKMVEAIQKYPDAGFYCCAGIVRNSDKSEFERLAKKYANKIQPINFFENPHVFLHTSASIVKKAILNKVGGFPIGMKRNQDYALFFTVALFTQTIYCGFPLSVYVGGVDGQATSTSIRNVFHHIIDRFNFIHLNSVKLETTNISYIIFLKYEIRHFILFFLKTNDNVSLSYLFKNLDPDIICHFSHIEKYIYQNFKFLSIVYIYVTKIRWRLRGFPIF